MNCRHRIVSRMMGGFVAIGMVVLFSNNANASRPSLPQMNNQKMDLVSTQNGADVTLDNAKKVTQKKDTTPKNEAKSNKKATFVDKDGDGINDGKENRFRSKGSKKSQRHRRNMLQKKRSLKKSGGGGNASSNHS